MAIKLSALPNLHKDPSWSQKKTHNWWKCEQTTKNLYHKAWLYYKMWAEEFRGVVLFLRHFFWLKSKEQNFLNMKPQKRAQSVKQQPHQLYRALLEINCLFICKGGVSKSTIITTSSYVKHHCFHHFLVTSFYSWMYYKTTCLIGDKPI